MKKLHLKDKAWLTMPQAMRFLGKSRGFVKDLIRAGELVGVQDGGSDQRIYIKVSTASIERYLEKEGEKLRRKLEGDAA